MQFVGGRLCMYVFVCLREVFMCVGQCAVCMHYPILLPHVFKTNFLQDNKIHLYTITVAT